MANYSLKKEIEIKYDVDVLVVGGGTAGTFAAISAARRGAKVLLVEKNGVLGGTMTTCGVNFPGLFYAWGKQIISGPCYESIERTAALGGAKIPEITRKPQYHFLEQIRLNKFIYMCVLDEMCKESGVDVVFHSMLSHIEEKENGVFAVVTGKIGMFAVKAYCVIDATGDANVTTMMGYPCEIGEAQQPATLANKLDGYDYASLDLDYIASYVDKAVKNGEIFSELNGKKIANYLRRHILDIHIPCRDCSDSESKGYTERIAREKLQKIIMFLKKIKGLERIFVSEVSSECGIRETKRIVGETVVSAKDYIEGKFFKDSIAYAFYPIDLHVMNGIKQQFFAEDEMAKIPYSAMIPKGSERIIAAGRIISSDRDANSALRVQAPCMAMGQAAGCAAVIAAKRSINLKDVDYGELCKALTELGAIVPEEKI